MNFNAKNKITELLIIALLGLSLLCKFRIFGFSSCRFNIICIFGDMNHHLQSRLKRLIFTKWLEITRTNFILLPQIYAFSCEFNGVIMEDVYNFITIHLTLIVLEGQNSYFAFFSSFSLPRLCRYLQQQEDYFFINKESHHVSCDSRFSTALIINFCGSL